MAYRNRNKSKQSELQTDILKNIRSTKKEALSSVRESVTPYRKATKGTLIATENGSDLSKIPAQISAPTGSKFSRSRDTKKALRQEAQAQIADIKAEAKVLKDRAKQGERFQTSSLNPRVFGGNQKAFRVFQNDAGISQNTGTQSLPTRESSNVLPPMDSIKSLPGASAYNNFSSSNLTNRNFSFPQMQSRGLSRFSGDFSGGMATSASQGAQDILKSTDEMIAERASMDPVFRALQEQATAEAQLNINPEDIRQQTLQELQGQVNAINSIYDQVLSQAKTQGKQRMGGSRAQQARGGRLGSDFGTAETEGVISYNQQQENQVQAERLKALSEVEILARNIADNEIGRLQSIKDRGVATTLELNQMEREAAMQGLQNVALAMVQRGVDPSSMTNEELNSISSKFGASSSDLLGMYQKVAPQQQSEFFNLSEGQKRYRINPTTGQAEEVASFMKPDSFSFESSFDSMGGVGGGAMSGSTQQLFQASQFIAPMITSQNQRDAFNAQVNSLMQRGDTQGLGEFLANQAFNTIADSTTKRKTIERAGMVNALGEINSLIAEIPADKLGLLKGNVQGFREKLGKTGDPRLAEIGSRITFLVDELGKSQSGAALSQNEEKLYRSLFPTVGKTKELNAVKLQALQDTLKFSVEDNLSRVIGTQGYSAIENAVFPILAEQSIITPLERQQLLQRGVSEQEIQQYISQKMSFTSASSNPIEEAKRRLGIIESSNNYGAVGPRQKDGHVALGKYQIMTFNLPKWSREALGFEVSPQEFLNNPEIQERITTHRLETIAQKYPNPIDWPSIWHSGVPLSEAQSRKDSLGTSTPQYVNRFLSIA